MAKSTSIRKIILRSLNSPPNTPGPIPARCLAWRGCHMGPTGRQPSASRRRGDGGFHSKAMLSQRYLPTRADHSTGCPVLLKFLNSFAVKKKKKKKKERKKRKESLEKEITTFEQNKRTQPNCSRKAHCLECDQNGFPVKTRGDPCTSVTPLTPDSAQPLV